VTFRVYKYGLLPPVVGSHLVDHQMRAAHTYRNVLVEIERDRRRFAQELISGCPEVAALESAALELAAERDRAREEISRTRAASRRRSDSAEQRAAVRDMEARVRDAWVRVGAARKAAARTESVRVGLAWSAMVASSRIREERARCGVYWGTYLLAEAAQDAANKSPTPPEFAPWRGSGRVSVQLQGGISLDELAGDTQVQVLPSRWAPREGARFGRGARQARTLRLRVQTDERRRPVWAEFPMQLHRELPEGARIKVVTVARARRGVCWDWSAQFTVDESACAPRRAAPASGVVALNLGFALRPGGIRAGYVVGDDGREQEILVLDDIRSSLDRADEVQSQRGLMLDEMRKGFLAWIESKGDDLPDWFRERTLTVASWRSFGRFAALALDWRRGWWDDGDAGYTLLERWRVNDLRLARYETGTRSTALRRRTDRFRVLAADLSRRYANLVVDDTDLTNFQRSPPPESEETERDAVKRQQRIAAGSDLRLALTNAFGADRVVTRPSREVTVTCAACGHRNDRASMTDAREQQCARCGRVDDQDGNACRNHLSWHARDVIGGSTSEAKKKPSRRDRMVAARRDRASRGVDDSSGSVVDGVDDA
jgi:hypothetical protein